VSADPPHLTEPRDPALEGLFRALTADGTAGELAGRQAALEMFRDSRRRDLDPRRRRLASSAGTAVAALVLTSGIAAAYAAALPAPVQHIAYRMLGSIGVPDTRGPAPSPGARSPGAPSSGPPRLAAPAPPGPSAPAAAACPCQRGGPGADAAGNLVLTAARAQIPAGGNAVLAGRLAPGGRPEAGVRIRLLEQAGGGTGWRDAGSAVTGRNGGLNLTVPHLTGNASFRLAGPGGAVSPPVAITVIPPVHLGLSAGMRPGVDVLTARAPFAQAGDVVILQELSGGVWHGAGERVLGQDHLALFTVLAPLSGQAEYRVVLPGTAVHGWSVSGWMRVAGLRPGRRAPP
jgi:hypothetical protein